MNSLMRFVACIVFMIGGTQVNAAPVLWINDASGNLGKVDLATGDVTLVGNMDVVMTDIAFDPAGNLYGISFTGLYSINQDTAVSTFIGNTGISSNSLVFGADGTLYTANNHLYTINPATGAATLVGSGGTPYNSSGDLAFLGDELYLSSAGGDRLIKLDKTTGAGALIGTIGFGSVFGMATDNNVDLYGASCTTILSLNTATGVGTSLVNYGGQGLGAAYGTSFINEAAPSAVPVPPAVWLFGSGLLGLIGATRGRVFLAMERRSESRQKR